MHETEEIVKEFFQFNYHPIYLFNKVKEAFAPEIEIRKIKKAKGVKFPEDLEAPFSLEQLGIFLEMAVSLPFFTFRNNLIIHDHDAAIISNEVLIQEQSEKNCLRVDITFYPHTGNVNQELMLYADLETVSPYSDEDQDLMRAGNRITFESLLLDYTVDDVQKIKFYPREVGYSHEYKQINLKHFKISKYLKKEEYPLFLDTPYIEDFVTYMCYK